VLRSIDFARVSFGDPDYLWLLAVPGLFLVLWVWRFLARRADRERLAHRRTLPIRERLALFGDLPFWLCLIAALTLLIVAVARPRGPATVLRQAGIDLIILQDASSSMRVQDVSGGRWQRSMRFLRMLGDSLSWQNDRIAMAVFARIAAPQVRLTKDPNTFFFFLDHLEKDAPFRLQDEATWDTNLERGVHWGIRLLERDEELHGKSLNAKVFVMVSDGQAWSGEVEKSILEAQARGIPIYTVGVGTLAGGAMPKFIGPGGDDMADPDTPTRSRLDRQALQQISAAAGGQYFELDRDGDRHIANSIIDAGKRMAPTLGITEEAEELYWYFLSFAAGFIVLGLLFIRERAELWVQLAAAVIMLTTLSTIFG
jgi:Ca-activated chloride channel family protein